MLGLALFVIFALVARNAEQLGSAADRIQVAHRITVTTHPADLRDGEAVKRVAAACAGADILVNNAGDIPGGSLLDIDEAKWRHAWDLKVFGFINMTREMLADMKARGGGVVVNVIGMAGEKLPYDYICGAVANAGLAAFTKALGAKSPEFGARVVGVHRPATRTDGVMALAKDKARLEFGDESRAGELVKSGRMGKIIGRSRWRRPWCTSPPRGRATSRA